MAAEETNAPSDAASWYELGFSRGLVEPSLLLGVPKNVLVLNGIVAVIFILDFGFWPILLITAIIHFTAIYVCKGDNQFFDCLQEYMRKKNYYGV